MFRLLLGFLMVGLATVGLANGPTNGVVAVNPGLAAMSNCFTRLDRFVEQVDALEQSVTNDATRLECIGDKLNKIKGLVELAHSFQETYTTHMAEGDLESAVGDQSLVMTACERAERLAKEAANCSTGSNGKPKKHPVEAAPPATNHPRLSVSLMPTAPASAIRDATTCCKQAKLAALLAAAMGLETANGAEAPTRELSKLKIEPLGGWNADECVTVDVLCEVVARALNLKVESTNDPYSYVQAARNDGLPVDTVLPRRRQESTPGLVLESEVRLFLARGYAPEMPSSRRLQPD